MISTWKRVSAPWVSRAEAAVLRLRSLQGMRRLAVCAAFGAAGAGAMPPVSSLLCGAAAFSLYFGVYLTEGLSRRRAFKDGAAFGFGYFTAGLYWITAALSVDWAQFWWLSPFALLGIPALACLYWGAAAAVAAGPRVSAGVRLWLFGGCFLAAEMLRSDLFGGFPWNLIGYVFTERTALLQTAALGGVHLLSALAAGVFLTPVAVVLALRSPKGSAGKKAAACWCAAALSACVAAGLYGERRIAGYEAYRASVPPGAMLRLVQSNFPQTLTWDPERRREQLRTLVDLSRADTPAGEEIRAVLWPESGFPYILADGEPMHPALKEAVPPGGLLMLGASSAAVDPLTGSLREARNSFFVFDQNEEKIRYDKHHLVPFGEYVPLKRFLPFVTKITEGMTDFTPGPGPRTLRLPGLPPFSPHICYEAIFPGEGADRSDPPQALVNVTNDAWYGITSGPYQHFAMAMTRGVEEGVPMARADNNGISGVTDPVGRTVTRIEPGVLGKADVRLPPAFPEPTPYALWRARAEAMKQAVFGAVQSKEAE